MKFKNIYKGIAAVVVATSVMVGCTDELKFGNAFIEKAPGGTQTLDTVFSSATYTQQFLTALYAKQYYGLPFSSTTGRNSDSPYSGKLDGLTDLYQLHWSGAYLFGGYYMNTLTANATPLVSYNNDMVWEVVRDCLILEDNIDRVPGLTAEQKAYMVAQERCIRASRYFDLFMNYGGLPIVKKTYTGNEDMSMKRGTIEETVNYMVDLLDSAIPNLLWAYDGNTTETNGTQVGRWTQAGAMALKAKILLFAASPMFNSADAYYPGTTEEQKPLVCYGNEDPARWEKALKACEEFMTALDEKGYYELTQPDLTGRSTDQDKCDAYRQAFRMGYISQFSKEVLHSVRVATIWGSQATYCWYSWGGIGDAPTRRNVYCPTQEYIDMFPWKDGTPFNWESDSTKGLVSGENGKLFYQYKAVRGGFNKIPSRDPRLYENACVTGQQKTLDWTAGKSSGNIYELWVGGNDASFDVAAEEDEIDPATGQKTGKKIIVMKENLTCSYSTGYGQIKYLLGSEYHRKFMQWVVVGLNEMYLMYAEALAQNGQTAKAVEYVNKVRARVGLAGLEKSNVPNLNCQFEKIDDVQTLVSCDKNVLLQEILRERACELGMSNNRFYDMVRYKRTDWMTKKLHGLLSFRLKKNSVGKMVRNLNPWIGDDKDNGEKEPNVYENQRFILNQPAGGRVLWQYEDDPNNPEVLKYLLSPLPQVEINKNYGLVQNPGW